MIITAEEFLNNLWLINDGNIPTKAILLPTDEIIYSINLETRNIEAPTVLSMEQDHAAETLYFLVDRMFGDTDLSTTTCVIQYINAVGEEGFQIVPFYDISTFSSHVTNDYIEAYVTEATYSPNKYYIYQGEGQYQLSSDSFQKNETYYVFNDTSLNKRYIKANVTEQSYLSNIFYYFDNEDLKYKIATEEFDPEEVYYVCVDKRVIKANVEYSNYKRNTYYILDSQNNLVLATGEYIKGQEYYTILDKPKILFPWTITGDVTREAGIVKYAVRFFKCDTENNIITYNLNTKVAQSRILEGMKINLEDEEFNDQISMSPTILEEIYSLINASKEDLYWIEA